MYKSKQKSNNNNKNNQSLDNKIQSQIDKALKSKAEHKSFDQGFNSTVSSTGTLLKLTPIPQDDSDSGRDGDQLLINRVQCKISFAGADPTQVMRMLIFRWNQDDSSAAPVVGDILQTTSPYSPLTRDNERAKKFSVLDDFFVGTSSTGINVKTKTVDKLFSSAIKFQTASTAGTGHLYAFMVSDSTAITHPTIAFIFRAYYYDF